MDLSKAPLTTWSATVNTASPAPSPVPLTKKTAPCIRSVWFRRTRCDGERIGKTFKSRIPAGAVLEVPVKKVKMEIARPHSRVVQATCKPLSRSTVIPVVVGQQIEIQCEGIRWGRFYEVDRLTSPCREEGTCKNDFVGEEAGRLFERENVNMTLVEKALGYPLSKTLVLDPVVESDLKCIFFCKLESTGRNDVVS
ncbi:hypothetical protein Q5P01_012003 [Channa striata]|uniref:Uncharacterized protein n=1 Tax=Channa striata TaxID=64152 RepID=A0AA88MRK2_CHASR|nr:hypothetical protein Q5P01_012003 [Channa striata]